MSDLDERLRSALHASVEHVAPAATPQEVIRSLRSGGGARRSVPSRRNRAAVLVAAAVFVAVVIGAALVALRAPGDDSGVVDVGPDPTAPPTDGWDPRSLGPGWHDLPAGPLGDLSPSAAVWTGRELIHWRGEGPGDGRWSSQSAAFDPSASRWENLPADPFGDAQILAGGGAWTGSEALFWTDEGIVAWNPVTRSWRAAATPPTELGYGVWTGAQVVFYLDGLSYDPAADAWSDVAEPPTPVGFPGNGADVVVVGSELYVLGGDTNLELDLIERDWAELDPMPAGDLDPVFDVAFTTAARVGDEIWVIDSSPGLGQRTGVARGFALSLDGSGWRRLEQSEVPPIESSEGQPELIQLDDWLYASHGGVQSLWSPTAGWTSQEDQLDRSGGYQLGIGTAIFRLGGGLAIYVPPTSTDPTATAAGWSTLPDGPVYGSTFPSAVWTGAELIVWGGETESETAWTDQGAAYDPTTRTWRTVAPSPLSARSGHVGVWTETEMIVCCGRSPDGAGRAAAAYDPASDTWRELSDPPFVARYGVAVWAGDRMLVTGGAMDGGAASDQLASYEPAADRWRVLAPPPRTIERGADAVWTGSKLIVWPGIYGDAGGLAYDPATDQWTELPDLPDELAPDGGSIVWTGTEIIVWGPDVDDSGTVGARIPLDGARWRPLAPAPLPAYRAFEGTPGSTSTVWTGDRMIAVAGSIGPTSDGSPIPTLAYDPAADSWSVIAPTSPDLYHPTLTTTGDAVIVGSRPAQQLPLR